MQNERRSPLRAGEAKIRRIALDAVLVALFVLFSVVLTFKTPFFEVSWASLPILVAAFLFGLPDAVAVAVLGSFLEQALSSYGLSVTTPLWMAPVILQALVAGALAYFVRRSGNRFSLLFPVVVLEVTIVVSELVLTAANIAALYLDGMIWEYALPALHLMLPGRLVNALVRMLLSYILVPPLVIALRRILRQGK